ncbi:MAG TPA: ABC transporter substrate-binding protein [Gemmataceae bacterium]|nr:ABC transporter substrate-binding protein [Gemmataceae bacterium]
MNTSLPPTPLRRARLGALLLLPLALAGAGWLVTALPAQAPKPEEEETAPVKKKPRPKVEEEEEAPRPRHKVVHVDEDEGKGPKKPAKAAAPEATTDLTTAARQWRGKNRTVYEFLDSVAVPHDRVVNRSVEKRVAPVARYLGNPPHFANRVTLYPYLDDQWVQGDRWEVRSTELTGIRYYEQIVLDRVNDFLQKPLDKDPAQKDYVARPEMLRLAETALSAALRYHDSALQLGQREGDEFDAMAGALRKRLLEVQMEQLKLLADAGDWDGAFALAIRLADAYPNSEEQLQIATPLAQLIGRAVESGNYDEDKLNQLQLRLRQLEDRFPGTAALNPINDKLKAQAQRMFDHAQELVDAGKKQEALDLLRRAEAIWPRLPGLHDYRLRLDNALAVLRVGVRNLPQHLSPALAATDAERQALDLLFESLVKLSTDPETGEEHYAPGLAEGPPRLVPLGRQFRLAHDAYWSNDKPVTAADVRWTVGLLKNPRWPGYQPALAELLDNVTVGGDPYRVSLTLQRGFVDPLSLMTFKLLPAEPWPGQALTPENERKFALAPVGSGPYQFAGPKRSAGGRDYVSFTASPNYGSRAGKAGLPHLREVEFFKTDDPVKDLQAHTIDLVPDLPSDKVKAAGDVAGVRVRTLPQNLRVYFLAVNYRQPNLQDVHLRLALAWAIDRAKILTDAFRRGGPGENVHHVLTGPFPAGSWACGQAQVGYRHDRARRELVEAQKAGLEGVELTLKYPNDDPAVKRAMEAVRDQVKTEIGVALNPVAVDPHDLKEQVEGAHDYDLAYYHYDFPSEAYWLWPLFDPQGTEEHGSNYLGYTNDADLQQDFGNVMAYCDFEKVREATHALSDRLCEKMPFIPLWQLDRHVALTTDLKTGPLDPLHLFSDVEQWRLEKK